MPTFYDQTNSNPPIALIGLTHDLIGSLISATATSILCDGYVYFASGNSGLNSNSTDSRYFTRDPASAYPHQLYNNTDNATEAYEFFRMRVTPANMEKIAHDINNNPPPGCPTPSTPYSEHSYDYKLSYAGVIQEATLYDYPATGDQAVMGSKFKNVGIYRRY